MIALPSTHDFSAINWQFLIANNNLNAARSCTRSFNRVLGILSNAA
jgi:hypothetical protein